MLENEGAIVSFFILFAFLAAFPGCASAAHNHAKETKSNGPNRFGSSVVFPATGNVYPKGHYQVTLNIGNPFRPYSFDIDTGSDLTWLQCDAPCTKCTPAPHGLYQPSKDLVTCVDPLCTSFYGPADHHCNSPKEQCDYEIEYADHGSSMGVLIRDFFPLRFTNGSTATPRLAFGCGYNQEVPNSVQPPFTDGILGLSKGKLSIVGQLSDLGLTKNVVGHCLSTQGGGFLFFGDGLIPSSGIFWTPIASNSNDKHYSLGPADLYFNGKATGIRGLPVVFDSGSTYTYLNSQAYNAVLGQLKKDLSGKGLKEETDDRSLPVCWKGSKPFKSIQDVRNLFKPLVLTFTKSKNVQFQLPPENYIVITDRGSACLGILNGAEVGLGNSNLIGDISMQDKLVIYDNEKQQVGWAQAICSKLPNRDEDNDHGSFWLANLGILEGHCPANYGF